MKRTGHNKLETAFHPKPAQVIKRKGSMITAKHMDKTVTRDASHFKYVEPPTEISPKISQKFSQDIRHFVGNQFAVGSQFYVVPAGIFIRHVDSGMRFNIILCLCTGHNKTCKKYMESFFLAGFFFFLFFPFVLDLKCFIPIRIRVLGHACYLEYITNHSFLEYIFFFFFLSFFVRTFIACFL